MRTVAESVVWICGLLLAYTYLGYPLLMWVRAARWPRPVRRQDHTPPLSIVVIARNEASRIESRIENLLALDYPRDRYEVWVASDGSADDTAERAGAYRQAGVEVVSFDVQRGKPAVLNELVPRARGEIVVLADARQRFEPGTLKALVAPFADPSVGAVSGELILTANACGTMVGEGVGFYWRYEKSIRRSESAVDSSVGATGAIYAIRRQLFEPLPPDTVLDDVLIPMRIARAGRRTLFEPAARAYDQAASTAAEEFTRKVRTIAGNFQLFARERWLLNPFQNPIWLQTLSHKVLRLTTPLLLVAMLGANLLLRDREPYRWILAAQGLFYAAALGGCALRDSRRRMPLLAVPYLVCLLGWATLVAFLRFLLGRQSAAWEKASA